MEKDKTYDQLHLDYTGTGESYSKKIGILQNSIFGVDLDKQAVEITQLNLLLRITEKGQRLPLLQQNIKCGNSLIDDPAIAGDKAFKWEEEFKQIMDEGGFDVVIGNPPYVTLRGKEKVSIEEGELEYYKKVFQTAEYKLNTFVMFTERAMVLLKEGGYLGFIIPDRLLSNEYFKKIRKMILDKCKIINIVDLKGGVFQDVVADTIILILQKEKDNKKREANKIKIVKNIENLQKNKYTLYSFPQKEYLSDKENVFIIDLPLESMGLFKKIEKDSQFIGDLFKIYVGIVTGDNSKFISDKKINEKYKQILIGRDIRRYGFEVKSRYVLFDKNQLWSNTDERVYETPQKILIRKTGINIIACLDIEKHYTEQTIYNLTPKKEGFDLKYVLAILNSKLINFYYRKKLITNIKSFPYIKGIHIAKFPIKLNNIKQKEIIKLVDKILYLNKRLNEIGDKKTDERARIEEEIKHTDNEIDGLVYRIYGITDEEKKIIEESLK
jgi:type I restriction-modification system DNA methylase subunit